MVKRLVDEFGAEFAINMKPYSPGTAGRVRLNVARFMERIEEESPDAYLPEFVDPMRTRVVCLWDRYTPRTQAGRVLLRRLLIQNHIDDAHVGHVWAVPEALKGPPLAQQLAAHRPRTLEIINALNVRHVVLIGSGSVHLWRPDLKLHQCHGGTYVWNNQWYVYPIMNPTAVSVDHRNMDELREDVRGIARVVNDDAIQLGNVCMECGERSETFDRDGVPWCQHHLKLNKSEGAEVTWKKLHAKQQQQTLL